MSSSAETRATLEVFRLDGEDYRLATTFAGETAVRAEPFERSSWNLGNAEVVAGFGVPMPRADIFSVPRAFALWTLALITLVFPFGCADQTKEADPLHQMLVAECERSVRCNCAHSEPDNDCQAFARKRASELRAQARNVGATTLDPDCALLHRDVADSVCRDGGIPYESEALSAAASANACVLFHGPHQEGERCEYPLELPYLGWSDCEAGSDCIDSGDGSRCRALDVAGVDSKCRDHDVYFSCPVDLICVDVDATTGLCLPLTKIGDPCVGFRGDLCAGPPGQWCDLDTSTCRASPGVGESCASPTDGCAADAFCREGVCEARPLPGEPCVSFGECALGLRCDDGLCEGYDACWF